ADGSFGGISLALLIALPAICEPKPLSEVEDSPAEVSKVPLSRTRCTAAHLFSPVVSEELALGYYCALTDTLLKVAITAGIATREATRNLIFLRALIIYVYPSLAATSATTH